MKLLVVSDTHGNYPAVIRAAELAGSCDAIIHLGDFCDDVLPVQSALDMDVIRVPGNCDALSTLPRELRLHFGTVPTLLCHGDRYGVKGGLSRLVTHAVRADVRMALFGHTHVPLVQEQDGILFINPGALMTEIPSPTFALVSLQDGTVSAEIISLPAHPVP